MQQGSELSPKSKNEFLGKQKGGPLRGRLCKEAKEEGNLSGKAMHDAVPACAKTHGLKKSQILEEG
jgi:hypothetical protein